MIITVATMKGGSGKSTVASCLAVYWHLRGRRPTLIDADPQRSIMRLAARERGLGGVAVIEDCDRRSREDRAADLAGRRAGDHRHAGISLEDDAGMPGGGGFPAGAGQAIAIRRRPDAGYAQLPDRTPDGRRPLFRCLLTQTTRDSVIARHIRSRTDRSGIAGAPERNEQPGRLSGSLSMGGDAQPDQLEGTGGEGNRRDRG